MIKEYVSNSTEDTEKIASDFAKELSKNDYVAMYGDLGVGKTAFVRGIAKGLNSQSIVKSPTYTIVNEYLCDTGKIYHFDLYRINDDDDLYSCGFYDYLGKGICISEWSENIEWAIPGDAYQISIEKCDDENKRIIKIRKDLK